MNMPVIDPKIISEVQGSMGVSPVQYTPQLQQQFDAYVDQASLDSAHKTAALESINMTDHEMQVVMNAIKAFQTDSAKGQEIGFQQASLKFEETQVPPSSEISADKQASIDSYDKTSFAPDNASAASAEQLQSFKVGQPITTDLSNSVSSSLPAPIEAFAKSLVKFRDSYRANLSEINDIMKNGADSISATDLLTVQTKIGTNSIFATMFANSESAIIGSLKQLLSATS